MRRFFARLDNITKIIPLKELTIALGNNDLANENPLRSFHGKWTKISKFGT